MKHETLSGRGGEKKTYHFTNFSFDPQENILPPKKYLSVCGLIIQNYDRYMNGNMG